MEAPTTIPSAWIRTRFPKVLSQPWQWWGPKWAFSDLVQRVVWLEVVAAAFLVFHEAADERHSFSPGCLEKVRVRHHCHKLFFHPHQEHFQSGYRPSTHSYLPVAFPDLLLAKSWEMVFLVSSEPSYSFSASCLLAVSRRSAGCAENQQGLTHTLPSACCLSSKYWPLAKGSIFFWQ